MLPLNALNVQLKDIQTTKAKVMEVIASVYYVNVGKMSCSQESIVVKKNGFEKSVATRIYQQVCVCGCVWVGDVYP